MLESQWLAVALAEMAETTHLLAVQAAVAADLGLYGSNFLPHRTITL